MKNIATNLSVWVLIAIFAGACLGHFYPEIALKQILNQGFKHNLIIADIEIKTTLSEFFSSVFISLIKLFINPIIFLTISLGIVAMGDLKKVGRLGAKAFLYFEVVTTFALVIGVAVAYLIQPGADFSTASIKAGDISKFTQGAKDFSWLAFFNSNVTLHFLIAAIIFGVFLSHYSGKEKVFGKEKIMLWLDKITKIIFRLLHKVMLLSPLGAFGGMAFTIGKFGINSLLPLAKLMLSVYCTMALFIFVVLYFILKFYRISLWRFLKYIRQELLIVLGTSSSESALPSLMEKLERMGCAKSVVGLAVPAGYSFNLDGSTIYLSMAVIFLAQVFNVNLDWQQILLLIGVLMLTSKGAAGVTGSGFIVLASTLTTLKVIPLEGLALLLGVDRFMSEARAITNIIGNGVATVWLANNEALFDRQKMDGAFSKNK